MMNKKILSAMAIGLALVVVALMIARVKNRHSEPSMSSGVTATSTISNTAPAFGQYLKAARTGYRAQLEQDPKLPKECLDFFDALQKIDFISVGNQTDQLTYQMLPVQPEACAGEFTTGFTAVQQDYLKKCKKDQNLSEKLSDECESAVFMMRAAVTRIVLKDKSIKDITDMGQLTDLVFSELAGAFATEGKLGSNFGKMKEISERMIELDPKLFAAHKINVMSNLIEGIIKNEQKLDSVESWNQAGKALARAKELNPNDEMLADAEIAVQTRGMDPATTLDVSQKMTAQEPDNSRGWFLMAYAQWKQGDHASSMANLKHAIALAPNNQEYQKTLQDISQPGANGDSFKAAFKVSINSDDFKH